VTIRIIAAAAVLAAFFAMPFLAQEESELDKLMKQVGEANGRIRKSTDMSATAKDAGLIVKLLKESESFWVKHNKADAVDWSQQGQKGASDLAAAASSGNADGVAAANKAMGASCQACHKVYRERLPDGSYKLKL
jgi:cytochrome c556